MTKHINMYAIYRTCAYSLNPFNIERNHIPSSGGSVKPKRPKLCEQPTSTINTLDKM